MSSRTVDDAPDLRLLFGTNVAGSWANSPEAYTSTTALQGYRMDRDPVRAGQPTAAAICDVMNISLVLMMVRLNVRVQLGPPSVC
jgi:hypothetical protein